MNKQRLKTFLFDHKVVLLFAVLCIGGIAASGQSMSFVVGELFTRVARNGFLVLSLIIPVMAGLGLNFGIVIGAMAAQIGVFFITHWGITGIWGFLLAMAISTPLAILFGFGVGKLFNRMKGTEMIGGLVLGFFTDGLYQLFFLYIVGGILPIHNSTLMIDTGIGVKNTIDLKDTIKYALDTVSMLHIIQVGVYLIIIFSIISLIIKLIKHQNLNWKQYLQLFIALGAIYSLTLLPITKPFLATERLQLIYAVEWICLGAILWQVATFLHYRLNLNRSWNWRKALVITLIIGFIYSLTYIPSIYKTLIYVQIPVLTYLCIAALCLFNIILMKTRLGQNMRTVGQSRTVARAAGIDVDYTRIMATIFSTVLASWGQLIFLQNVGTFSTYGAHTQVGQFAIASLLVGGASVQKATSKQALLGVVLFHTLFIVAPLAGKELFGNAMIGEYFRVFVSYGVIAMTLALHAWKKIDPNIEKTHVSPISQTASSS